MNFLIFISLHLYYVNVNTLQNITDISQCKLSHLGLGFSGTQSETEGGVRCQSWTTTKPLHKIDESISDKMFPERSKETAKNYCRNPLRKIDGPWCYSLSSDLIDDTCGIPLCSYNDCKLTGPGMEYGGPHVKTVSDKKCLKWDKHRNKVRNNSGDIYEQEKFSKRRFPDETRGDAAKFCRNPNSDPGGPWCFVNADEGKSVVEKQYCDIPFCYEENCVTFTQDSNMYSHYTIFNGSLTNLTFGLKLWHPDDELNENSARILLSLFALPLSGEEIDELQIGIEIYISNSKSAMTVGNKDKPEYEPTVGVLKSSSFTYFSLEWNSGFVTFSLEGAPKPIFLSEYRWKKDLFGANREKFFYYSIQGKNILWSLPFCDDEDECELHTTTSSNFERFWPLRHTNSSHDLKFYIRAFHSVIVKFQLSASIQFPNLLLTLAHKSDNITKVVLYENVKGSETELKRVTVLKLLDYWEWRQFTVTFFGNTMQVYWERDIGSQLIIEAKHSLISQMRWFSPGSDDSLAEWTFFCSVADVLVPPKPWPPECVLNTDEIGYKGTQSVTRKGHPCVPWVYDKEHEDEIKKDRVIKNWNYCKDPFHEKKGTYCYAVSQSPKKKISKEKCLLRMCRSSECRMAGTGNDYIGKLNTTRSNRTCQSWTENDPHKVNTAYLNGSLYADQNVSLAENYCRDPSRNIAGSWCYTTDIKVQWDLCSVRDCSFPEECIIMTRGNGDGRFIYILPEWKDSALGGGLHFALKEWDPDKLDGILFEMFPLNNGSGFLQLVIGADDNERVTVLYGDKDSKSAELVKEKSMPHLIPAGKWAAFWLQMRKGEILLGHEGNSEPIFSWEHDNKEASFEPGFMTYMSIQNNIIGVHFKCTECHTERTSTKNVTRVMSINLWKPTETTTYRNLSIYARGNGIMLIPLLLLPQSGDYYAVAIGDQGTYIVFLKNMPVKNTTASYAIVNTKEPTLNEKEWTHYFIEFDEKNIEIFKNNKTVLKYTTKKIFLFYWFTITVEKGWVEWAVNCQPPDIDGDPRDGGWSEWSAFQCTVSCGGGTGIRHRSCSNPRPNIRGTLCKGPHSNTAACNEFECGDLSPDTSSKIRQNLKLTHFSLVVNEADKVLIENDAELLVMITKDSPKSSYQWTRNGAYLKEIPGKIEFINDNIVINKVESQRDSGIYACVLYRIHGERVIIRVVTVAIASKTPDIVTRATLHMTLVCNAAVLGYIYTDLAQAWLLNGKVVIDYGITTLAAVITEKIDPMFLNYSGTWSCRVTQQDLKFTWIIKTMKVNVKTAPNWITHLMEDEFTKPIFGHFKNEKTVLFALIFIVLILFVMVFCGLALYLKFGTLPQRKYQRLRNKP